MVDNDYSEFSANGARGFGYIVNDLNAKLPVDQDSYIQKHTGRGIINNAKSVMADSLSKVMAVYALKTSAEQRAFDLDEIHKYAAEF
ncbi:MAG: hypothetical protein K5929_03970 [Lachnospiraceae bacterium]|nr:hypothetical protein [Lachnospiraceae bacterium]